MLRRTVIQLIAETPAAHGVFEASTETDRTVYATIKSVNYNEYYRAREHDLYPTLVFVLRDYAEYKGEPVCICEGRRYNIIRTYITPQNEIELTVEEAAPKEATTS